VASLKHYYPEVKTVSVRGNLQTRIKRLESSEMDALMLAFAGVQRLGLDDLIKHNFPLNQIVPAVGQGSMAIEVNHDLDADKKEFIRNAVNHPETERCLLAERAFLGAIQGGCSIPAFAHAILIDNGISMHGGVVSLDGSSLVHLTVEEHEITPAEVGIRLAGKVLSSGGKEILEDVKMKLPKKDES
jgi:hydroxymethylbilane synthase